MSDAALAPQQGARAGSSGADEALLELLSLLDHAAYRFVTPTNETIGLNRRARREHGRRTLRDVFGWSLDFDRGDLDPALWRALEQAGALEPDGDRWRSRLRVSSVCEQLFLHSAYPTTAEDAVFLGPDSYRFAQFIAAEGGRGLARRILDIGVGAGVGAVVAAGLHPAARSVGTDVNAAALRLARINGRHAGLELELIQADGFPQSETGFDLILANPPFISGRGGRTYRDGGSELGMEVSMAWAIGGAERLAPGGRMLLYTGSPIVEGTDPFREALHRKLEWLGRRLDYAEIDPDIFGSMVGQGDYERVERIAAVGAVIR